MKNQTCCFTGYRNIPANEYAAIQKRLESEIINLINQGVRNFCADGALGFDTMAALAVLRLKEKYPYVQLILILPCKEQTRGWTEADKKIYGQTVDGVTPDRVASSLGFIFASLHSVKNLSATACLI